MTARFFFLQFLFADLFSVTIKPQGDQLRNHRAVFDQTSLRVQKPRQRQCYHNVLTRNGWGEKVLEFSRDFLFVKSGFHGFVSFFCYLISSPPPQDLIMLYRL